MKKVVGYITSDSFKNGFVSHQVQNQSIKNFLQNHNSSHLLSWTEYKNAAPLVFNSLLQENFYEGICFYSIEQLLSFPEALNTLYMLKNSSRWIGFSREGLFFCGPNGFEDVLKMWWLINSISKQNTGIAQ